MVSIISNKNNGQFRFLWKEVWGDSTNYFSNSGFDSGIIGINYLSDLNEQIENLNNVQGPITGLIFKSNGYVEKPIKVMQIENLGKLKTLEKCSHSMDLLKN